ncbi:hypothetical protein [Zobellella denitrificans]|uniref:hypothetical protein n=1 Tax=Zobellella denitrificans TaxID=347534 RepID=UPI0018E08A82|nr:hypothetical protein [Zobellella denitrificans]
MPEELCALADVLSDRKSIETCDQEPGWKLEAGSWKLEAGSWKLEAGSWKLEVNDKGCGLLAKGQQPF